MRRLPNLLFVVDVRRDDLAVQEANKLGIPVIAMVDTNCDPDPVDFVIPSNDDAIRAVKLILATMANAVLEGHNLLNSLQADDQDVSGIADNEAPERYLGPSTLAKLKAADVSKETEDLLEGASLEGIRIVREHEVVAAPSAPIFQIAGDDEPDGVDNLLADAAAQLA